MSQKTIQFLANVSALWSVFVFPFIYIFTPVFFL